MESKKIAQTKNSVETRDSLANVQSKSKQNAVNMDSKQMPSANNSIPKQRVIKQIVSLDSKKLKDLGIESNILSALTKFNGKDKPFFKSKPTIGVNNVKPSTSTGSMNVSNEIPQERKTICSNIRSIIASRNVAAANKISDTPPAKKIQVLSNVLLSEKKLDLKDITALASSTPIQSNSSIPYVPQVPQSSPVKVIQRIKAEPVVSDSQQSFNRDNSVHASSTKTKATADEKPVLESHETETNPKSDNEQNALKGFTATEVIEPRSQLESLRLHIRKKCTPIASAANKSKSSTKRIKPKSKKITKTPLKNVSKESSPIDDIVQKTQTELRADVKAQEETEMSMESETREAEMKTIAAESDATALNEFDNQDTNWSNTLSNSGTVSTEPSEAESDLETLIKEAQLTIESEQAEAQSNVMNAAEVSNVPKKPRLIQKELLDLLAEHVDKDRIIDEFLDSTINSFRTECISPSDSDSSVENADVSTIDACEHFEIIEKEDLKDSNIQSSSIEFHVAVPVELRGSEVTEEMDLQSAAIQKSQSGSRKRKSSTKSRVSTKRKKSQTIIDDSSQEIIAAKDHSVLNEAPNTLVPELNDVEMDQEHSKTEDESEKIVLQSSDPPIEPDVQPVATKRGRKSKQKVLNDYFEVLNSKGSDTPDKLDESLNGTNSSVAKSSRYGRVIKPKTFDIETVSTKTSRKSCNETTEAFILPNKSYNENEIKPEITVAIPPKKRGRDKRPDSILSFSDDPVQDRDSAKNTIDTNSTLAIEPSTSRRKSVKESISSNETVIDSRKASVTPKTKAIAIDDNKAAGTHDVTVPDTLPYPVLDGQGNALDEAVHKITQENVVPKRRGRLPKKFLKNESDTPCHAIEVSQDENSVDQRDKSNECLEVTPKRRGRPSKKVTPNEFLSQTWPAPTPAPSPSETNNESLDNCFKTPAAETKKRRGRAPKNTMDVTVKPEISDQPEETSSTLAAQTQQAETATQPEEIIPTPKKRGRPRLTPLAEGEDPYPNQPKVTCGNCQKQIAESKWTAHVAVHIGVTWRVGIDEPMDVDDTATMSRVMIRYMKHKKIQYLKCEKCGEKKRSAVGYVSHIEVCGLTPDEIKALKAECEYCKQLYRKVSLASHQQSFCPVKRLEMAQQQADEAIKTACETDTIEQGEEVIYSESGRPKRIIKKIKPTSKPVDDFIKVGSKITGGTFKSWSNQLREENIIKCSNETCTFTSSVLTEMRSHYKECKESSHQCKICHLAVDSREKIVQHIESEHADELKIDESEDDGDDADDDDFKAGNQSSSSSDDDYVDDECFERPNERSGKKHFKPAKRKRTIPLKRIMEEESPAYWEMVQTYYTRILNTRPGYYPKAYQWTKEFVEQNYDLDAVVLKRHLRTSIEHFRLPQREVNKFLGLLEPKSVEFSYLKQSEYQLTASQAADQQWSNLNLFESVTTEHLQSQSSILFCGGRIITADWIPFPKEYSGNQVLVICTRNKGGKPINVTNWQPTEKCKNVIQLWSVSMATETQIQQTEFMYGIAYDDGPVCTMSFCPSEAYIPSKRLAIVAMPDTSGNISIISLPDSVSKVRGNVPPVIKLKPEIRLKLGLKPNEVTSQTVTQMTWLRTKGHKVLCAGYNTGLVAIWNFDHLNSSYLCQKDASDGIPVLLPQYTFVAGQSYVTQLDLHADNDGSVRWLLVGTLDRKVRLYDLYDPQLMPFTSQIFKSRIISGTWPLHWPIYLTMIDAALTRLNGGLHIKPVLYTNNQPRNTNFSNDCEPSNLAFSDWLNTGIFGNDVGDLFIINFQQLLLHDRFDESSEQKILSSTDVFVEPSSSIDGAKDGIRILFNDFEDNTHAPKINTRILPVEQQPFARITRVSINPNESHHKLYAIGYELGFCRIHLIP